MMNNRNSGTGIPIWDLILGREPEVASMKWGPVSIDLMKRVGTEGISYCGTPRVGGRVSPHTLILKPTPDRSGAIYLGTPAMKYIASEGWKLSDDDLIRKAGGDPAGMPKDQKGRAAHRASAQICDQIKSRFVTLAIALVMDLEVMCDISTLQKVMQKALRYGDAITVEEGELSLDLKRDLGLLDIKEYIVDLAESRGLTFCIDLHKIVARSVKNSYGKLVGGPWTDEAREIATTSSMPAGVAFLVKNQGYTLKRVIKRASRPLVKVTQSVT